MLKCLKRLFAVLLILLFLFPQKLNASERVIHVWMQESSIEYDINSIELMETYFNEVLEAFEIDSRPPLTYNIRYYSRDFENTSILACMVPYSPVNNCYEIIMSDKKSIEKVDNFEKTAKHEIIHVLTNGYKSNFDNWQIEALTELSARYAMDYKHNAGAWFNANRIIMYKDEVKVIKEQIEACGMELEFALKVFVKSPEALYNLMYVYNDVLL